MGYLFSSLQLLSRENDKLIKKCELLSKEVSILHSVFSQYLPEQIHRDVRKQLENFQQQHQHLLNMWTDAPPPLQTGRGAEGPTSLSPSSSSSSSFVDSSPPPPPPPHQQHYHHHHQQDQEFSSSQPHQDQLFSSHHHQYHDHHHQL